MGNNKKTTKNAMVLRFFTKPAGAGATGAASEGKVKAMGAAAAEPEG